MFVSDGVLKEGIFKKYLKDNRGFTLFELIVVIVIIGILMAVFFPKLEGRKLAAQISSVEAEMMRIYEAAASWKANKSKVTYQGVSIGVLIDAGLLPNNDEQGGKKYFGPFGNEYSISPTGTNNLRVQITSGTLPDNQSVGIEPGADSVCQILSDRFKTRGYDATCNGNELTVVI